MPPAARHQAADRSGVSQAEKGTGPLAVLAPAEPLLLGGRDHPAVDDQRRGRVVEQRIDAEYAHN